MRNVCEEEKQLHLATVAFASLKPSRSERIHPPRDETIIAAFKARALEATLSRNTKSAVDKQDGESDDDPNTCTDLGPSPCLCNNNNIHPTASSADATPINSISN